MTTLPPSTSPAAAWYPDPAGSGGLRYWDGLGWTEHVTPPPPAAWAVAPAPGGGQGPAPAPAPGRVGRRVWPLFVVIGLVFVAGLVSALVMGVPRAIRAGGRMTDVAAQATARDAIDAAGVIRARDGTYVNVTPARLAELEPDITFTDRLSTDFTTASVYASSHEVAVAVLSLTGRCYVLIEVDGVQTAGRMQADRPCMAALAFGGVVPDDF